jgi:LCP family protein required for cell wall assembly
MSRWRGCFFSVLIALGLCIASCGITLGVYWLLPLPHIDVLVLGYDARQGEGYVARTDSILLVGINADQIKVGMLSLPRDLFVEVPNYGQQRINTINVLGEQAQTGSGAQLVIDSLNGEFDITLDRYVRLNFEAFVALVDAVGGVDIYVEKTIIDYEYPTADYGVETIQFDMGWSHMDGATALKYVRTRHADDDYARAKRQQQVTSALATKLLNPFSWQVVFGVWNTYVSTNITLGDMLLLAPSIVMSGGNWERLVVDRETIVAGENGARPNHEALAPFIQSYFD